VQLSERFAGQPIAALRGHLASEARRARPADRATLARLTGEFHVLLAETTGNRLFSDNLRRLAALTGLVIAQYDAAATSACPEHEHGDIVAAIEAGDAKRAERLMLTISITSSMASDRPTRCPSTSTSSRSSGGQRRRQRLP